LGERILTDDLMGPELFQEFVFGHDAIAALHEVDQHVKALALQGAGKTAAAEFVALRIEVVIAKDLDHAAAPFSLRCAASWMMRSRRPVALTHQKMSQHHHENVIPLSRLNVMAGLYSHST
jgi:hypothetical protein